MKEISMREKHSWFCGDDDIEYNIFEEFDGDSIGILHPNALDDLLNAKYITEEVYDLSLRLAKSFRALENTDLWNASAVRTSKQWHSVLSLADEIKSKLINRVE